MKPCLYKLLFIYMGTPKSWLFSLTQHTSPALGSSRGCHDKNPPPQIVATTAWNWRKRIEFAKWYLLAEELRTQKFMPWFTVLLIGHQDSNALRRQCRVGTVQLSKMNTRKKYQWEKVPSGVWYFFLRKKYHIFLGKFPKKMWEIENCCLDYIS